MIYLIKSHATHNLSVSDPELQKEPIREYEDSEK